MLFVPQDRFTRTRTKNFKNFQKHIELRVQECSKYIEIESHYISEISNNLFFNILERSELETCV